MPNLPNEELMLPDELPSAGIGFCNRWRKHLEAEGRFPRRVRLSERKHAYVRREILAFAATKIAERTAPNSTLTEKKGPTGSDAGRPNSEGYLHDDNYQKSTTTAKP